MILLPDMNINGHVLSIQDPYLLDGYIVTDIERHMSYDIFQSITLKNENNQCLTISSDELEYKFRRKMQDFISRYGSYAAVMGRGDVHNWAEYTSSKYLNDIEEQCFHRSYRGANYISYLKRALRLQGREYFESALIDNYESYYNWLYEPFRTATIDTNSLISIRNGATCSSPYSDGYISTTTVNIGTYRKEYIHSYNYKPEYTHYYMPDEDKATTLLLGAEIEVDCGGQSEEHAKQVLEIMCGINTENNHALETKIYCMRDGSLTNGIEFATMPCSLEYHKQKMEYKKMFKYLIKNGYKAHDTTTCGLHIHANRSYLGKTELVQQLTISKILYILEKFNDEVCIIARRNSRYSQFVGAGKNEKSIVELYGKYKDKDKYVALNMKHSETIEFRCFKGTLKYETFILTLEFVKNIIDYAKSINIEEIELIKWSDLMDTFSDELKNYYNERLEKENKKKEEKKTSNGNVVMNVVDCRNVNLNASSFADCIYIDESHPVSAYSYEDSLLHYAYQDSLFGRAFADCSSRVVVNCNNDIQQTERTLLDTLKHKEKSLKKQIKHTSNFLEKKNLETELKEVQKEIKKEKKRIKLNNIT